MEIPILKNSMCKTKMLICSVKEKAMEQTTTGSQLNEKTTSVDRCQPMFEEKSI